MALDRNSGAVRAGLFRDLPALLRPKSVIVLNDTQVIPARMDARKPTGGQVELLLVRPAPEVPIPKEAIEALHQHMAPHAPGPARFVELWHVMARGLGKRAEGMVLKVGDDVWANVLLSGTQGSYKVAIAGHGHASVLDAAAAHGRMPLPPYIEALRRREQEEQGLKPGRDTTTAEDQVRYQTVYARTRGSVAAPTAGLHFTPALLARLVAEGHEIVQLTLAVGPGTFRPVSEEDPSRHHMDTEHYELPEATWRTIDAARAQGRPVVAVGTTVVRTLEGAFRQGWRPGAGATNIFIKPGDDFHVVTDLITNFHLPRSTLLMLVAAFAGRNNVLAAYEKAVQEGFRFYSYGDAMFISPWEALS